MKQKTKKHISTNNGPVFPVEYQGQPKERKYKIINYIRKVYGYQVPVRDIINGEHKIVLNQAGYIAGICTKIYSPGTGHK